MWKIIPQKIPFCLYLTIPQQRLQCKESGFVQTLQCKFFWPSVRAINHFAIRKTALCGQHVLFLTTQRCFDDGWQSNVSGSCLLTLVIGGNISDLVAMSEWPNCEGVENAKPMLRGISKGGVSLPFPSKLLHKPASSTKHLQSLHSWGCLSACRREEKRSWPWPHVLPHPYTRKVLIIFTRNLNWRAWSDF